MFSCSIKWTFTRP